MPLQAMESEEINDLVSKVSPDLLMQYEQAGVSQHLMAVLAKYNFTTIRMIQMFGSTLEAVEAQLVVLGLEAKTGMEAFSQIAAFKCAWSACKAMSVAEEQHQAEKKILGMTRLLKPAEYKRIQSSFERVHGKQPDTHLPGSCILEQLEKEIEEGELHASRLTELPSKAEVLAADRDRKDAQGCPVMLTMTGTMIRQSIKVKVPLPKDPEDLRYRIRLLYNATEFTKLKNTSFASFTSNSKDVWANHLDYILGPEVRGKQITDHNGRVLKEADWRLVLDYEYEVRVRAVELMNDGNKANGFKKMDLAAALEAARDDKHLRHEKFIEQMSCRMKRGRSRSPKPRPVKKTKVKGGGKGGGKGGAAGSTQQQQDEDEKPTKKMPAGFPEKYKGKVLASVFENEPICFRFGTKKCKDKKCKRRHVCQICFGDHPYISCDKV